MIITKKAIPRRTLLRGIGAALALPTLDAMIPALANAAGKPIHRLGIVYVPNGMRMDHWTPSTVGSGFKFPSILKPMESYRDQVQVLSGLWGVDGVDGIGLFNGGSLAQDILLSPLINQKLLFLSSTNSFGFLLFIASILADIIGTTICLAL